MIPQILSLLGNHLWQSTVFAALAWLVTLALRKNRAAIRYWIWLAASVKFLIPFSLLVSVGSQLGWRTAPAIGRPAFSQVVVQVSQPFGPTAVQRLPITSAPTASNPVPVLLFVVWLCGFAIGVIFWLRLWRRIHVALRSAIPLDLNLPIPAKSSHARLEPGVFGIHKPILLLPEGITGLLTPAQLQAILAHELCHVRRRDNLTAAVHMVVEAIFWFHPLVWWIRARLLEERERACDQEVLRAGSEPQAYAEGILNVCKLYLESPLDCVSGITGADLKRRIGEIIGHRVQNHLSFGRKLLLAAAGMAVVVGPIVVGFLNAPGVRAQSQSEHLAFEVASVRSNNSADFRNVQLQFLPGGRLVIRNVPLLIIVATAYNLPFQSPRLNWGQEWLRVAGERYDIEATPEKGAIAPDLSVNAREEKMRLMLQSLLEERFKLKMRKEQKEQPVYALVVAKGGPKLQKSKKQEKDCLDLPSGLQTGCHSVGGGQGRGIHGDAVNMADVVLFVQNWTDRPVVDKTGLNDLYDIQTEGWAPMRQRPPGPDGAPPPGDAGLNDPDRQTLYDVFRQLGLRMESQRAVVDMFVIEHLERPSGN